jgi:hypothetical protein
VLITIQMNVAYSSDGGLRQRSTFLLNGDRNSIMQTEGTPSVRRVV